MQRKKGRRSGRRSPGAMTDRVSGAMRLVFEPRQGCVATPGAAGGEFINTCSTLPKTSHEVAPQTRRWSGFDVRDISVVQTIDVMTWAARCSGQTARYV